jgi:hypothetical protein
VFLPRNKEKLPIQMLVSGFNPTSIKQTTRQVQKYFIFNRKVRIDTICARALSPRKKMKKNRTIYFCGGFLTFFFYFEISRFVIGHQFSSHFLLVCAFINLFAAMDLFFRFHKVFFVWV